MHRVVRHSRWVAVRGGAVIVAALALAACNQQAPPPTLSLTSEPNENVPVLINNAPAGETPASIEFPPETGRVLVTVDMPQYRRYQQIVDLPSTGEVQHTIILEPRTGFVTFESDPGFAEVLIDGEVIGKTPLPNAEIPVGECAYTLRMEDYELEHSSFTVEQDNSYTRVHKLVPIPARLNIISKPSRATVFLNDTPQRALTPNTYEVRPGSYRVSVYTKGYVGSEDFVELKPNEDRTLNVSLIEGNAPLGMVFIPAGEFIFGIDEGSPDERPKQRIHLPGFYIDRYETTNRQWLRVFPDHTFEPGKEDHPVTNISYREAVVYAKVLGKRLPTEMEWEKAARGTDGRDWPWGTVYDPKRSNSADFAVNNELRAVGQFRSGVSPYGCYDMAGNALEWTSSWYQPYPGNEEITVEYGQLYKVLRGGSFRNSRSDVRVTRRFFDTPDSKKADYGLRLVADLGAELPTVFEPIEDPGEGEEESESGN